MILIYGIVPFKKFYFAYRKYGLKPIAAEDYGNMEASFYVVAAAWKRNPYMTLFNLKGQ